MATNETNPKQTNQGGEGRKDERKGVDVGRDIPDHSDAGNAQAPEGDSPAPSRLKKAGGTARAASGERTRAKVGTTATTRGKSRSESDGALTTKRRLGRPVSRNAPIPGSASSG